jgi:FLVCR family feline leukemia virus subgroup C receptor-related protein
LFLSKKPNSSLKSFLADEACLIMPLNGTKVDYAKTINETQDQPNGPGGLYVKLYWRRWLVLVAFALISMMNAFNWIEYSIIQDIVVFYYNESLPVGKDAQNEVVNWMSMVYMITYVPLVFPAMFLLDRQGLRMCCALGALLTCIGSWLKCAAIHPSRFSLALAGQTVCGIAQAFTLGYEWY